MGWLVALIASIGAAIFYFKKHKKETKAATPQKDKPPINTAQAKVEKPKTQEPTKSTPEPPKEPSKEERLKQQQLNAFKNLK
jgi:hypothetical protein